MTALDSLIMILVLLYHLMTLAFLPSTVVNGQQICTNGPVEERAFLINDGLLSLASQ